MASPPVSPLLSRMTSGFGPRPGRTTGRTTVHQGLDFRGRRGDPVYAADGGQVAFIARDAAPRRTRGYGNVIGIHHPDGYWSVYAHLSKVYVSEGQNVDAGQLIGAIGNTTNGKFRRMGSHLHFEVRRPRPDGGAPLPAPYGAYNVDPQAWLASRGVEVGGRRITVNPAAGGVEPALMQRLPKGVAGLGRIDPEQLRIGTQHELEHTADPAVARQIAIDHLKEIPDYYARLTALESRFRRGLPPALGRPVAGLGQGPSPIEVVDDSEGLPDEPIRDPWTFSPLPAAGIILVTAVAALPVVVGVWGARALRGGA